MVALGATGHYTSNPTISGDGRYIAYQDVQQSVRVDVHVYDRLTGDKQLANLTPTGSPSKYGTNSWGPLISNNGHSILFMSSSVDMGAPSGGNGMFVYDRVNKSTETIITDGGAHRFDRWRPAISSDGRFVAYRSTVSYGSADSTIYVRDMLNKTTQATRAVAPFPGLLDSKLLISDDGRYVAYTSKATQNGPKDLMVHDRLNSTTEQVNINNSGEREAMPEGTLNFSMNADASVFAFASRSSNLAPNDKGVNADVFIRDRKAGTTERISYGSSNGSGIANDSGVTGASISADGRFVAFFGYGTPGGALGLYRYDRATKSAQRAPMKNLAMGFIRNPLISANGRYVVFDYSNPDTASVTYLATTDFGAVSGLTLSSKKLALTEGGAAATYTAVLDQEPSADVQVSIAPDSQLSVARPQLTFSPANWATPQIVSVQAVADGIVEGQHSGSVLHTVTSADPAYTVVPAAYVAVTITDTRVPTIDAPATWGQPALPVHGTAAPGATVLLSAVNLAGGGVTAVSVVADARGAWSWTLPGLAEGKYELQAEADGVKSQVRPVELVFAKPALDITASVTTYSSGLSFNRATQQFSGTFTVTNATGAALKGPFQVQFDALPAGITLLNASGSHDGSPYVSVNDAGLAPGASFSFPVLYLNPAKLGLPYTNKIYSGKF
ncbi:PD40 domain-containing protein [Rugamonas rubra]|nr:PD40 domain-containing protein [Rugamonas rubra]